MRDTTRARVGLRASRQRRHLKLARKSSAGRVNGLELDFEPGLPNQSDELRAPPILASQRPRRGARDGSGIGVTPTERDVALMYMQQSGKASKMLFEVRMGMIDRGADVSLISQFPTEQEILFAPLTGLEVASVPRVEGDVIVVELRLSCNLHEYAAVGLNPMSSYLRACTCAIHVFGLRVGAASRLRRSSARCRRGTRRWCRT